MNTNEFFMNNLSEEDMAQMHADHVNQDAIANIRKNIRTGPSLSECEECGDDIPKERQDAVPGCTTCIYCQTKLERK